ncbi:serine hydrolase domain-containing protein [Streptomyces sp. NPDC057638]|uniref:serine hydrolase domain-containing protein n=1 Tax=Streptomyces sp. NPDC057638 TaxID=3346190 RepID=UPI0036A8F171
MAARHTAARTSVVGLVAAALAVTAFAVPAQAADARGGDARGAKHAATQRAMDEVVKAGIPGMLAGVSDRNGVWKSTSGVGNLATNAPRGVNDKFRIASITKPMVATVLLQLEQEKRIDLDDTVEKWLPGLVRGNGNDGRKITIRQLLNHTSGIYNYTSAPAFYLHYLHPPTFPVQRFATHRPETLVKFAVAHPPTFAPGAGQQYSNTGYVLAGMVIKKVTGNSHGKEIHERVVKPLGLRNTVFPDADPKMPKPSGRAYTRLFHPLLKPLDATQHNMTWLAAAGDGISNSEDLNRFFSALLKGRLLTKSSLAAMKTTPPVPPGTPYDGYGLGIFTFRTSCGVKLWGHTGGTPGSQSEAVTTDDGSHSVTNNRNGDWVDIAPVTEAAYCGKPGGTRRLPVL